MRGREEKRGDGEERRAKERRAEQSRGWGWVEYGRGCERPYPVRADGPNPGPDSQDSRRPDAALRELRLERAATTNGSGRSGHSGEDATEAVKRHC